MNSDEIFIDKVINYILIETKGENFRSIISNILKYLNENICEKFSEKNKCDFSKASLGDKIYSFDKIEDLRRTTYENLEKEMLNSQTIEYTNYLKKLLIFIKSKTFLIVKDFENEMEKSILKCGDKDENNLGIRRTNDCENYMNIFKELERFLMFVYFKNDEKLYKQYVLTVLGPAVEPAVEPAAEPVLTVSPVSLVSPVSPVSPAQVSPEPAQVVLPVAPTPIPAQLTPEEYNSIERNYYYFNKKNQVFDKIQDDINKKLIIGFYNNILKVCNDNDETKSYIICENLQKYATAIDINKDIIIKKTVENDIDKILFKSAPDINELNEDYKKYVIVSEVNLTLIKNIYIEIKNVINEQLKNIKKNEDKAKINILKILLYYVYKIKKGQDDLINKKGKILDKTDLYKLYLVTDNTFLTKIKGFSQIDIDRLFNFILDLFDFIDNWYNKNKNENDYTQKLYTTSLYNYENSNVKVNDEKIVILVEKYKKIIENTAKDVIKSMNDYINNIFQKYNTNKKDILKKLGNDDTKLNEIISISNLAKGFFGRIVRIFEMKNDEKKIRNYKCNMDIDDSKGFCENVNCKDIDKLSYDLDNECIIALKVLNKLNILENSKQSENKLIIELIKYIQDYCKNDIKNEKKFRKYVNTCVNKQDEIDPRVFYLSDKSNEIITQYISQLKSFTKNQITYINDIFKNLLNNKDKVEKIIDNNYIGKTIKKENDEMVLIYNIFLSDINIAYFLFNYIKDEAEKDIKNKGKKDNILYKKSEEEKNKKILIMKILREELNNINIAHNNNNLKDEEEFKNYDNWREYIKTYDNILKTKIEEKSIEEFQTILDTKLKKFSIYKQPQQPEQQQPEQQPEPVAGGAAGGVS